MQTFVPMSNFSPTSDSAPIDALAARTLRYVLSGVLIYAIPFFTVEIPFFASRKSEGSALFLVVVLGTLLSMFFLQKGKVHLASWVFFSVAWSFAIVLTIFTGGISSPALFFYMPFTVAMAWTLGPIVAWIGAAVGVSLTLAMALLENAGVHLPHYFPAPPLSTWTVMLFFVVTTTIPLFEVFRTVTGALTKLYQQCAELVRQQHKLRESEERFRTLADSAPVMIWSSGADKLFTFFNKPWLDFTGRSLQQELVDGWAEGVHPEDQHRCLHIYNSSFDARRSFHMEYRLRRADGEYRWILDHGTPLYQNNEFTGFIGSCIDLTEQKLMSDRLRAQTVQLVDAQRLANLGSWQRDLDDGSLDCSDELLRILGLSNNTPSTLWAFLRHVHPMDRKRVVEADIEARSSVRPVELSYRIIRPDGEVRYVRSIVEEIKNHWGAAVRTLGTMQDVTEQVMAAQQLRENEERLKNAERLAHVGSWHWDLKSNAVSWSDEMFHIFGQPLDYVPSYEDILQAVLPQDRDRVEQAVEACLNEKSGFSCEVQITRPDGDIRTITCIGQIALDEQSSPVRMFGATQDITNLRRAQREDFSRQKLESVGTLASGITHDFNNLLGSVLAQAELALEEIAVGSYPEEELKAIRNVSIRGSEIVRQLMVYAGKESAAAGSVDVSRMVQEMIELLKVSVSKHAVLEVNLGRDLPTVQADAGQLRQVLMNLVMNASEALGDGDGVIRVTTICVRAGQDSSGKIANRLTGRDYLQLEVSDTGCGIPIETQAKVFDPFFTTKSTAGGLGLAVVQGIVLRLGGSIHLQSEPGKGTTLRISLPCAETVIEETRNPITGTEELARSLQDVTILVVEDEGVLRKAVAKSLRKIGLKVLEAADGSCAIELLRLNRNNIDVILLDMTIPGPPCSEVVAEAAKAGDEIRVILTSAYSQEMVTDQIVSPQVRGFLRKPFRLGDLVKTLQDILFS